jgi:hypothetical protein
VVFFGALTGGVTLPLGHTAPENARPQVAFFGALTGITIPLGHSVPENAGLQTVAPWATAITAGPSDEAGQVLTFLVNADNPALFTTLPTIAPDGTLTYTLAPGATGQTTVTVRLHDDGGSASGGVDTSAAQTFTITVTAVNHAGPVNGGGEIGKGRNFGFVAQPHTTGGFTGNVAYQDKVNNIKLQSTAITSVSVQNDNVHAVITGTATVNGVAGYVFTITVEDNGEPGTGVDRFRIQFTGPTRYDSNAVAASGGLLTAGNIQVHKTGRTIPDTMEASTATEPAPGAAVSLVEPANKAIVAALKAKSTSLQPQPLIDWSGDLKRPVTPLPALAGTNDAKTLTQQLIDWSAGPSVLEPALPDPLETLKLPKPLPEISMSTTSTGTTARIVW